MVIKKQANRKIPIDGRILIGLGLLLLGVCLKYALDSYLKDRLEEGLTRAYGAEVNMGSLRTHFLPPSLSIHRVEITHRQQPEYNLIEIGEIKIQLLWEGLIHGQWISPEASLRQIQFQSKRRKVGQLMGPENEKTKTQHQIKEMETITHSKKKELEEKISQLSKAPFKNLVKKMKRIKIDLRNLKTLESSFQKMSHIYKEIKKESKAEEINQALFGSQVSSLMESIQHYKKMGRELMPSSTHQSRFWFKKVMIFSSSQDGQSGDLQGLITNLTDQAKPLGLPTQMELKGNFPHQQITDLFVKISIDHTTEIPKEKVELSIGSFPLKGESLFKSPHLELAYHSAQGQTRFTFLAEGQNLHVTKQSLFKNIKYYHRAQDSKLNGLLGDITKTMDPLSLDLKINSSPQTLNFHIDSNLGTKLSKAILGLRSADHPF